MADDEIRYDLLTQDALRGVIRRVLTLVQRSGLPGQHHLYIAFDTGAEGVSVSKRLKEQYPEEMTIVLQYQFWDLQVTNDRFEVKLSFGSLPERLVVPFQAVKAFYDPSAQFGLQFGKPGAANDLARQHMASALPDFVADADEAAQQRPPASTRAATPGARAIAQACGQRRTASRPAPVRRGGGSARPVPQEIGARRPLGLKLNPFANTAQNLGVRAAKVLITSREGLANRRRGPA